MTRRLISLIAALLLVFTLLPAGAALASAAATATLLGVRDVHPGDGKTFQIQVRNDEQASLLGLVPAARVNAVRIVLPRHVGVQTAPGTATGPNDSWTAQRQDSGNLQVWNFSTTSNGIAGGSTGTFTFPADILPPSNGDREAQFQVGVSSDGGNSFNTLSGSGLLANIRILEVLGDTLGPLSPDGVLNGTGTSGQQIVYGLSVRNHAQQGVPVTATLESDRDDDAEDVTELIGGGATGSFEIPVTLHSTNSDRTSTFTAKVTAETAEAPDLIDTFIVQAAPFLDLDRNTFKDLVSGDNVRYVNDRHTYKFQIEGRKLNTPGLTIDGGRLEVADSTFDLDAGDVDFGGPGSREPLTFASGRVLGEYRDHDGLFHLTGIDDNDAPFMQTMPIRVTNLLTLDGIFPELEIDLRLPNGQGSVKIGDTVTVEGRVVNKPNAPANYFTFSDVQVVVPGVGSKDVPVSTTNGGRAFSGSVTLSAEDFPVAAVDSPLVIDHPQLPNSHPLPFVNDIYAQGSVVDLARNGSSGGSDDEEFNPYHPRLINPARTLLDQERFGSNVVVEVSIHELTDVIGGCSALHWSVSGANVREVLYSNGQSCGSGTDPKDGKRVLRLWESIDRNATPRVTYTPGSTILTRGQNLRDTASHLTPQSVVDTVRGIVPLRPLIDRVLRNNGEETAYYDSQEEAYYTRFGGLDPVVRATQGLPGEWFEVTDCVDRENWLQRVLVTDGEYAEASLDVGNVALGQQETFRRCIQLRNGAGLSPQTELTLVVDRIAPTIDTVARVAGTNDVTVEFNEPIIAGTNSASSWQAFELVENQDGASGTDEWYYPVNRVTGERSSRTLEVEFGNHGAFGGTVYEFIALNPEARRYLDRAGNALADQKTVANAI